MTNQIHIVYTTSNHYAPQTFTLDKEVTFEQANNFFESFCTLEEVVSAVLFGRTGEFISTFNGG